ncbi:MAG TPA: hypothetical protein VJ842_19575 [Pyrinomonadaceae bacterium]|nr:hypothetical protein [Pyrinomonadaceae bacterium]
MDWIGLVNAIASVATAVGVLLAGWQIRTAKEAARSEFENDLAQQYREIIRRIPIKALLGKKLDARELNNTLDDFFRYIDLSNEQVFLRQNNRVSKATWRLWCEGIKLKLELESFREAWVYFKQESPSSFKELQMLELKDYFKSDPRKWGKNWEQELKSLQAKSAKQLDK